MTSIMTFHIIISNTNILKGLWGRRIHAKYCSVALNLEVAVMLLHVGCLLRLKTRRRVSYTPHCSKGIFSTALVYMYDIGIVYISSARMCLCVCSMCFVVYYWGCKRTIDISVLTA